MSTAGLGPFVLELIVRNGLLAVVIYFNLLVVIPKLQRKESTAYGIFLIVFALAFYVGFKNLHDDYFNKWLTNGTEKQNYFHSTFYNLSIVIFYLAFSSALYLSKQWYLQKELLRKTELEKLNNELAYLKAQINPHFLFNSLNTVFFQIDKHNLAARETLVRFSEMLRYQLYECNENEVAIEKEISYLKNYVALQSLRKDKNYDITFSCSHLLTRFTLPPMLLLPFVENAFKHVSHFTDRKNIIRIDADRTGHYFKMTVLNTTDKQPQPEAGGIGLKNVKRRLELLYNNRHTLHIQHDAGWFQIRLSLKISET